MSKTKYWEGTQANWPGTPKAPPMKIRETQVRKFLHGRACEVTKAVTIWKMTNSLALNRVGQTEVTVCRLQYLAGSLRVKQGQLPAKVPGTHGGARSGTGDRYPNPPLANQRFQVFDLLQLEVLLDGLVPREFTSLDEPVKPEKVAFQMLREALRGNGLVMIDMASAQAAVNNQESGCEEITPCRALIVRAIENSEKARQLRLSECERRRVGRAAHNAAKRETR